MAKVAYYNPGLKTVRNQEYGTSLGKCNSFRSGLLNEFEANDPRYKFTILGSWRYDFNQGRYCAGKLL